ncbi:MAG: EF-P beta-lysylation protein EpmB [Gammaproteobacteria bacterium]|nr:MAG: EF-P beta-lysylation protein EpmB [Gammaproteobacteria bacterium]
MPAMIPSKSVPWQSSEWPRHLSEALRDPRELLTRLDLDPESVPYERDAAFEMRVPMPFLARMRPGDPNDPLLRQVLPLRVEREHFPGFVADPLEEAAVTVAPGLIQKYAGRALLIASPVCAVHCRYCFRRHFPYAEHRQDLSFPSLRHIETNPTIREVILSGGDPLMLKDSVLARLVGAIEAIPHVRWLRFHTRVPVVIPQRVTTELLDLLTQTRLTTSMVLHLNHPNELDDLLGTALTALHASGITLLNQSVLLRGVNDNCQALIQLSEALYQQHVLPYYLHMPDKVAGTHHFDVPEERARQLVRQMSDALPGYLVPRLAREVPGATAKEILNFL